MVPGPPAGRDRSARLPSCARCAPLGRTLAHRTADHSERCTARQTAMVQEMSVSAQWQPVGDQFYRLDRVYTLSDAALARRDLADHSVTAASHAGPIALVRDTSKPVLLGKYDAAGAANQVAVYSPAGALLQTITVSPPFWRTQLRSQCRLTTALFGATFCAVGRTDPDRPPVLDRRREPRHSDRSRPVPPLRPLDPPQPSALVLPTRHPEPRRDRRPRPRGQGLARRVRRPPRRRLLCRGSHPCRGQDGWLRDRRRLEGQAKARGRG